MDLFHHQFGQIIQNVFQRVRFRTAPGRHVLQYRLFASIKLHDIRHIAIYGLVIGNPGARRIGNGDPARAIHIHDARYTQRAVGVEIQRVQIVVIDPPIQHINWFIAARGAHRHPAINHPQIMPLDQFHAHFVGKERVFVIGRIVNAGGQHRDNRIFGGGTDGKAAVQHLGVIADRLHPVAGEQFGKHLQHGFAVFQHIADTRRRAGVILQHIKLVLAGADQINADDMGIDPAGGGDANHLRQERGVFGNHLNGQATGADDFLPVIDVMQKRIDRPDPLFDALGQPRPFASRNDARDDIKRDQPLGRFGPSIDVKGDAGQAEHFLRLALLAAQTGRIFGLKPIVKGFIRAAQALILRLAWPLTHALSLARVEAVPPHFIETIILAHVFIICAKIGGTIGLVVFAGPAKAFA